ncbi:flagellar basal body rod protein FlgC [Fretibacter rubidus]|uniref:flagellar basal body rod protein FlgC n=1 Tax=Fretibacter rubidus TaxID=570162 RepID=UPI00352A350A
MEALKISMTGLDVEWQRLQVIAQNLANINSTRNELGEVYRPQRLLSGPDVTFSTLLQGDKAAQKATGVRVMGVENTPNGVRVAFEPNHPHADENGMVQYPNVDHAAEMTQMIKASRVYEANLTAISIAQQMYNRALDMGRG